MSVQKSSNRFWSAMLTGLLVGANFVIANVLLRSKDSRWDLTQDKRFEISESSKSIIDRFEGTVNVKCYFSSEIPKRFNHVERIVAEKLSEYDELAEGKLVYEIVDPATTGNEDDLQELNDMNVPALPLEENEGALNRRVLNCYLTIVFRYGSRKSVINLFQIGGALSDPGVFASQLEFLTTQAVHNVTNERKTVGVLAPIDAPQANNRQQPAADQPKNQNVNFFSQWLARNNDVVILDPALVNEGDLIPAEVDVLICYRLRDMSELGLYVIDQYVMNGGRVAFFVDNGTIDHNLKSKQTQIGNTYVQDFDIPAYEFVTFEHNLGELLQHYGVRVRGEVVLDESCYDCQYLKSKEARRNPMTRQVQTVPIMDFTPYPVWPVVPARDEEGKVIAKDQVSSSWPILAPSDEFVLVNAFPLDLSEDDLARHNGKADVLLRSGPRSWTMGLKDNTFSPNPGELPPPTEFESVNLAVLLQGQFQSFFKGQEIPLPVGAQGQVMPAKEELKISRLDGAKEPGMVFVMGDADFIHDRILQAIMQIPVQKSKVRRQDPRATRMIYAAIRFAGNAIDLLCNGEEAKSMFTLLNREVTARTIRDVTNDDPIMTKIIGTNIWGLPFGVLLLGLMRVIWRRLSTGAVSV